MVVIGCGYGRESVHIARKARHVYGIDVSRKILDKAVGHTRARGVTNFTPVLAEGFAEAVPKGVGLVFSHVVFQHLTRDLARNYLQALSLKLAPDGAMVIQFCEDFAVPPEADAALEVYEPSVSYTLRQIVDLARPRLKLQLARSYMATPTALWHWAYLLRDPDYFASADVTDATPRDDHMNVDLAAPYQTYADKLSTSGGGVCFSTGLQPWGYAAAIGLGLGGDVKAETVDIGIETDSEAVYLLTVDRAYQPVGERVVVPPKAFAQRVTLPLGRAAYSLIVQAGNDPKASKVTLSRVDLQLV